MRTAERKEAIEMTRAEGENEQRQRTRPKVATHSRPDTRKKDGRWGPARWPAPRGNTGEKLTTEVCKETTRVRNFQQTERQV